MKLSEKEQKELECILEENKDSIDQDFLAYRKAMAEERINTAQDQKKEKMSQPEVKAEVQ